MFCLTRDQLRLYLDDRLEDEARMEIVEHLSLCGGCRRQLVLSHETDSETTGEECSSTPALEELMERARAIAQASPLPHRRASARPWAARRWAALAASLVAFLGLLALNLGREPPEPAPSDSDTLRTGPAGQLRLEVLAPADGDVVESRQIELRWSTLPAATRYTLTVLDSLGNVLLRTTTTESVLGFDLTALDPPLESGESCFWYVTSDLKDGTFLESEVQLLTLRLPKRR